MTSTSAANAHQAARRRSRSSREPRDGERADGTRRARGTPPPPALRGARPCRGRRGAPRRPASSRSPPRRTSAARRRGRCPLGGVGDSPRLPEASPVASLIAIRTEAATTETSAVRRCGVTRPNAIRPVPQAPRRAGRRGSRAISTPPAELDWRRASRRGARRRSRRRRTAAGSPPASPVPAPMRSSDRNQSIVRDDERPEGRERKQQPRPPSRGSSPGRGAAASRSA